MTNRGHEKGKKNLTPVETRSLVDKLNLGANPDRLSDEYDIGLTQIRVIMRQWKSFVKMKRKFNDF